MCDGPGDGKVDKTYRIDDIACEGCGVCAYFCPEEAIEFGPTVNGQLFVSQTRCGPMVHAKLGIAEENSGKLVTRVRKEAKQLAQQQHRELIIVDGPPGIGCPVIASLTGACLAVVITEPTLSGEHDLQRVLQLAKHFRIPAAVCVNKWDLNPAITERIEHKAEADDAAVAGRVRYDKQVTSAQIHAQATVERECEAAEDIRRLWENLKDVGGRYGARL
jgi:MinD superfamily P-loop ATPase